MTPSSDQPSTRRTWTAAERKRAVKAYHARGDRTVADVAAEIGVGTALLYYWIKRAAEGTLADMPGKASTSTAITVAKPKSTAITRRRAEPPAPQAFTATFATSSKLGESEREELARLRVEVRRLRRAIVVAYELNPGDDYRH